MTKKRIFFVFNSFWTQFDIAETLMQGKNRTHLLNIGVLIVLALIAVGALLTIGWFPSHEKLNPVSRVFAIACEINNGDLYPRWLSLANALQSVPMFNYYSPIAYFATAFLAASGLPILVSLKLIVFQMFLVGGIGMYLWVLTKVNRAMAHSGTFRSQILKLITKHEFETLANAHCSGCSFRTAQRLRLHSTSQYNR